MTTTLTKTDLTKALDAYAAPRGQFRLVQVPPLRYLMLDGHGDPNTSLEFADAVATLYPIAYGLKLASKRELGHDFVAPPLEALWWADDMSSYTTRRTKGEWDWTLLLLVPDWVPDAMVAAGIERVATTKAPPRIADVRVETLDEGLCLQTLHVGSYDDEAPVLARLHDEVIPAQGLRMSGRHHEIYLSDMRRTSPEKRRTVLRQPVSCA